MLFQIQRKNAFSYDTTFGDICQIFDKECGHDRGRGFLGIGVAGYEPQANKKFFGAAVFQKCCRGVGEQPTFAKQIKLANKTITKI